MDREGFMRHIENPALTDWKKGLAQLPLRITADQEAAIDRIEELNLLLRTLAYLGHKIESSHDAGFDNLILLAQEKGHLGRADTLAFCLHALLVSRRSTKFPKCFPPLNSITLKVSGSAPHWNSSAMNSGSPINTTCF